MNRISPKDVRIFAAGALAFKGFQSLAGLPQYAILLFLHSSAGTLNVINLLIPILTIVLLPLGIAILFRNETAVRVSKMYLGFWLVVCVIVTLLLLAVSGKSQWPEITSFSTDAVTLVLILWLLSTRKFHEGRESQTSN